MKDTTTTNDRLKGTEKTAPVESESFGNDEGGDAGHGHKMRHGLGWGKGIVSDVKRTILTHWKEEMTNLNSKVSLRGCSMCLFFLYITVSSHIFFTIADCH